MDRRRTDLKQVLLKMASNRFMHSCLARPAPTVFGTMAGSTWMSWLPNPHRDTAPLIRYCSFEALSKSAGGEQVIDPNIYSTASELTTRRSSDRWTQLPVDIILPSSG